MFTICGRCFSELFDIVSHVSFGHLSKFNFIAGKVLDGNQSAASLLAGAVHQKVSMELDSRLTDNETEVSIDDFGVWIDPIGGCNVTARQSYFK